jgi:hypothetical protein
MKNKIGQQQMPFCIIYKPHQRMNLKGKAMDFLQWQNQRIKCFIQVLMLISMFKRKLLKMFHSKVKMCQHTLIEVKDLERT